MQERIMTIPYGEGANAEVFKYSLFLVFCNRAVAATIAAITLVVSVVPTTTPYIDFVQRQPCTYYNIFPSSSACAKSTNSHPAILYNV
jgi:hypothetical protein